MRSLALHACVASISFSGFADVDNQHLKHAASIHKGAFRDAIALRYGWLPSNIPSTCTCGKSFTVEHALSCPLGGFPSIRHNEIRDLTANS